MKHASVLTEVFVVSEVDLRPLVGTRIRIRGRVLGDASAPEGPALVVKVDRIERMSAREEP